jgi:hypothetical protein
MEQSVHLFWCVFIVILLLILKFISKDPINDRRPYCVNNVLSENCKKCPQGAYCDTYDVSGCVLGYNPSKPWSIIGKSKLVCIPDEELDTALKNTALEVVSIMQARTLEKHCTNYDLEYNEVWSMSKLESEAKKISSKYSTDSSFTYNFNKKLKNGQFESMGLYSDKSIDNDVYIDQVKYSLSCKFKIFSHKHKY